MKAIRKSYTDPAGVRSTQAVWTVFYYTAHANGTMTIVVQAHATATAFASGALPRTQEPLAFPVLSAELAAPILNAPSGDASPHEAIQGRILAYMLTQDRWNGGELLDL